MKHILSLFLCFACFNIQAQDLNLGLHIGGANYSGDLTQNFAHLGETNLAGGLYVRNKFKDVFAYKLQYTLGHISGSDANADTSVDGLARQARNLSFRTRLSEIAFHLEYHALNGYIKSSPFSVYAFAGFALLDFKPQALFNNNWYDLQPLGTEGQGTDGNDDYYKTKTLAIPLGIGAMWSPNANFTVGLEFAARFVNTDYLDDVSGIYADIDMLTNENGALSAHLADRSGEAVGLTLPPNNGGSQRGDTGQRDMYFTGALSIGYNFGVSIGSGAGCPNMIR